MKISLHGATVLFLPLMIRVATADSVADKPHRKAKFGAMDALGMISSLGGLSRTSFDGLPLARFVSFDNKGGNIDINWDITIPFISIPLDSEDDKGELQPLVRVNGRSISVVAAVAAFLALVPIFTRTPSGHHYRSAESSDWARTGNSINDMLFDNDYVAPCVQRVVCSVVSMASHADDPTQAEELIDSLSSAKWFEAMTNGTVVQDAVRIGRAGDRNCSQVYKNCPITPRLLKSLMSQFGTI